MFYPLVDFPTGDVNKNLGTGRTHFFLPLWLGKQLGLYTVYGGGGYWYNRGHGYKDWFLLDAGMQRRMTDNLRLGFDVFHATSSKTGLKETTGFNLGGAYDLTANHHLLFSVGRRAVRGKLFGCRSLQRENKTWMRGPSPRMTTVACAIHLADSSEGHKNFPRTVLRASGDCRTSARRTSCRGIWATRLPFESRRHGAAASKSPARAAGALGQPARRY